LIDKEFDMKKITMDKKYKTRNGKSVRVLCTDMLRPKQTPYPIVALVEWFNEQERVINYTKRGSYSKGTEHSFDLVEVSEWDDFKIDEKVLVRQHGQDYWIHRNFAGIDEDSGQPTTFSKGQSSWTSASKPALYEECRRPTKEELS